jgi:hypothetical protein
MMESNYIHKVHQMLLNGHIVVREFALEASIVSNLASHYLPK